MVLSLFSLSGPRKREHSMSSVSFYCYIPLPASFSAHNDKNPDWYPHERLQGCLIKTGCITFPNLYYPIYYSKETNNCLIHLFTSCSKKFPSVCALVCVYLHFRKIATDKIPPCWANAFYGQLEIQFHFCILIIRHKTYAFRSGISTICDGTYIILTDIQLKCYSYSKLL